MTLNVEILIPTFATTMKIAATAGSSVVFIGANGSGKTRLGVYIDARLSSNGVEVHRIAAHRSLTLNPNVIPPNSEVASNRLFYGYDNGDFHYKLGHRFQDKPETVLLNDFDHVLSALYAENNDVSIAYRQACIENPDQKNSPPPAKIDRLSAIWQRVLPHRKLVVLAGNIKTQTTDGKEYSAADMSDGERVIFYVVAQSLLAKPNTLLIFDEPELHINKSILAKLWDEIESARPDCSFLYITHDVEFAGSRHAATKYALRAYRKEPTEAWDIELVPNDAEIPDDVLATIIGSRRPILFVEGDGGSLDSSLYRRVYSGLTVIPVGSCDSVIHTVASFMTRLELHRLWCAGLVDADGRTDEEAAYLETKRVYRLPVSEVENLLLLPNVFLAVAKLLNFSPPDSQAKLADLRTFVMTQAGNKIDGICLRFTKRRLDAQMKKIGLASNNIGELDAEFKSATAGVDAYAIFGEIKAILTAALETQDYEKVLLYFDNKGVNGGIISGHGAEQKSATVAPA